MQKSIVQVLKWNKGNIEVPIITLIRFRQRFWLAVNGF